MVPVPALTGLPGCQSLDAGSMMAIETRTTNGSERLRPKCVAAQDENNHRDRLSYAEWCWGFSHADR